MEAAGIEPASPRCDRGVLPLYDAPADNLYTSFYSLSRINQLFFRIPKSKSPFFVTDDIFNIYAPCCGLIVGRVTYRHQLNYCNIIWYFKNLFYLCRIKRTYPAGCQALLCGFEGNVL